MFEHKSEPIASRATFVRRIAISFGISLAMIALALGIGICGYRWIADLSWIDSLLNAALILGGMGPVDRLATSGAKLFAAAYAISSGLGSYL